MFITTLWRRARGRESENFAILLPRETVTTRSTVQDGVLFQRNTGVYVPWEGLRCCAKHIVMLISVLPLPPPATVLLLVHLESFVHVGKVGTANCHGSRDGGRREGCFVDMGCPERVYG